MPFADLFFGCMPCLGTPPPPVLKLHVDADRDGIVDNPYGKVHLWTWGPAGRGAIILCNNDDGNASRVIAPLDLLSGNALVTEIPNAPGGLDNTDTTIDGANDVSDIAPLELRRHPAGRDFPANWSGRLSVAGGMHHRVRIFDTRAAGAPEVIGPTLGASHLIANLDTAPAVLYLGIEAIVYPSSVFDGFVDLTIETLNPGHGVTHTHVARVRVAPWMAMHHLNAVRQVFVLDDGNNFGHDVFRNDLADGVTAMVAVPAPTTANAVAYNRDRWFRDVMKVGFATLPGTGAPATRHVPAILRTANNRQSSHAGCLLDRFAWRELVGARMGYVAPQLPFITGSSLDSFGNLECSPPVTANGLNYRFGRIIYGQDNARAMSASVRQFLIAQKVQRPFSVDTSWLEVGHVDEVFTFCPWPGTPKGFKLLIASPAEAIQILDRTAGPPLNEGLAPICVAPQADPAWLLVAAAYPHLTVDAVRNDAIFRAHQGTVQGHIDTIEATLVAELGLQPADIIRMPVLYTVTGMAGRYVAYLPNPANMLVVTRPDGCANLCVPKPFGPMVAGQCIFEADITNKLQAAYEPAAAPVVNKGEIHFIDDFYTYHAAMGEIHCGTNEVRLPAVDRWWWQLDWVT